MTGLISRSGAFCLCYGVAPREEKPRVLVLLRPDLSPSAKPRPLACNPGGHILSQEKPRMAALRELKEELVHPNGASVLPRIGTRRLFFIAAGRDDAFLWFAYGCPLLRHEMGRLQQYAQDFKDKQGFAQAVTKASGGEVCGAELLTVPDLFSRMRSGTLAYRCNHGQEPILSFLGALASPRAHTNGKRLLTPASFVHE